MEKKNLYASLGLISNLLPRTIKNVWSLELGKNI